MLLYATIKSAIADDTGLGNTILHIHGGLAILMIARLLMRRSLGSFWPFCAVVMLEWLNEILDRVNHGSWRWPDTIDDAINTLFWPLVISVGVRLRPLAGREKAVAATASPPPSNLPEPDIETTDAAPNRPTREESLS